MIKCITISPAGTPWIEEFESMEALDTSLKDSATPEYHKAVMYDLSREDVAVQKNGTDFDVYVKI